MQRRIIILTCIVLLATSVTAQNLEKIWNFDSDKTGNIPEGFTNEVGEWKVIADPTAPSKPNVLAQLGKNSVSTFNVILITDTNYKDVELSVNIKAITGKEDQVRSFYNRLGTKQGRQQF